MVEYYVGIKPIVIRKSDISPLSIYFPRGSSKSTTEFLNYLIALEKLKNIENEAKNMKGE